VSNTPNNKSSARTKNEESFIILIIRRGRMKLVSNLFSNYTPKWVKIKKSRKTILITVPTLRQPVDELQDF
jgi:hypothetical protein